MPTALASHIEPRRHSTSWLRVALFALTTLAAALASATDDVPPLKDGYAVQGAKVLEERLLRTVIGNRPKAIERLTPWSQAVIRKVERYYRRQGWSLVRVHFGLSDDNEPTFDIDHGVLTSRTRLARTASC